METLQILLKPASAACNLRCRYCFYRDEAAHRQSADRGRMQPAVMRAVIDKALQAADNCIFAFQGGEPTLAGLDFYQNFVQYVASQKRPGQRVEYILQTNACTLDEDWAAFLAKHRFLVGVSLDGTRRMHDANRIGGSGAGTFRRVLGGLRRLQEKRVPVNVLCVCTAQNADNMEAVYHFFMERGLSSQQYIPCMDPLSAPAGSEPYSLTPRAWGKAMCALFDCWFADKARGLPVYVRQFDNYLNMLLGGQPEACAMYGKCTMQHVVEADGSVYPCDFYALDSFCMGNIRQTDFVALQEASMHPASCRFFQNATQRDSRCPHCRWYPLCRGGCRRDCFQKDGIFYNRYCEAYQGFFAYAIERLEWLAGRLDPRA